MPDINDLDLIADKLPAVNPQEIPDNRGFSQPLPQPGAYELRLPADISKSYKSVLADVGQRIAVVFEDANGLTVVKTGQGVKARVTNVEREVDGKLVSDFGTLLKVLGSTKIFTDNKEYAEELNSLGPNKTFVADYDWSGFCDPRNDVYGESGRIPGKKGCGVRYQTWIPSKPRADGATVKLIPAEAGVFHERFVCACGAVVRCFGDIRRIRK